MQANMERVRYAVQEQLSTTQEDNVSQNKQNIEVAIKVETE